MAGMPFDHQSLADQIVQDGEIQNAIGTILNRHATLQEQITGIKAPSAELASSYQDTIDSFKEIRGVDLFYPYLGTGAGRGPFVELADGSVKYDFTCGIGVHVMGHAHPKVMEAHLQAALEDVTMQGNLQQNEASLKLSKKLIALAKRNGAPMEHCFLSSSGVMAGENALKMAMQKNTPAKRVLAFERCFAGRSLAFSQINDKPAFRVGLPEMLDVDYVPFYDEADPEGSTQRAYDILKGHLETHPGNYAAMFFELIQGEGGFYPGCANFHRKLMELCKEHKVAVLADEVQTFARTYEPFAFQQFGLDDLIDIVWIGKAAQVCATLYTSEWKPQPGLIAQTYTASTATVYAALAILDELDTGGYWGENGKTHQLHQFFVTQLQTLAKKHPSLLTGPYGLGAMTGCTPLGGDSEKVLALIHRLYDKGLIAFIAGANPMRLRFLLPIGTLQEEHILEAVALLEETLLELA